MFGARMQSIQCSSRKDHRLLRGDGIKQIIKIFFFSAWECKSPDSKGILLERSIINEKNKTKQKDNIVACHPEIILQK